MSRIVNARITDQNIKRLPKKEIKGLKSSFGGFGLGQTETIQVEIKCDEIMAHAFGERKVHNTQEIKKLNNLDYLIKIQIAPTTEIYRLLAGWNNHIREIKPQIIRNGAKSIIKEKNN